MKREKKEQVVPVAHFHSSSHDDFYLATSQDGENIDLESCRSPTEHPGVLEQGSHHLEKQLHDLNLTSLGKQLEYKIT